LLGLAGTSKHHILHATIYLRSMSDFAAMNRVWDAWVPHGHTPARATCEAALATPDYLVEIVVTAARV
jgi:enamine deaminase RidA (YjgF/YER057c/UK114 family)